MPRKTPLLVEIGQGLSIMVGLPTIAFWTTKGRPKKPKKGTFGFNSQTSSLEFWNGTTWLKAQMS